MSIPPLVCSTPPPLEQVESEDDAGQDEFAVQYALSQEDDDELSTYDEYQRTVPMSPYHHIQQENNPENEQSSEPVSPEREETVHVKTECEKECGHVLSGHSKTTIDEDNNIEDLDLKFELSSVKANLEDGSKETPVTKHELPEPQPNPVISNEERSDTPLENDSDHTSTVQGDLSDGISNVDVPASDNVEDENSIEELQNTDNGASKSHSGALGIELQGNLSYEKEEDLNDFQFIPTEINLEQEVLGDLGFNQTSGFGQDESAKSKSMVTADDDFSDFDAFQLDNNTTDTAVGNIESSVISTDHNPWKSDSSPIEDFGDFQATFEDNSVSYNTTDIHEQSKTTPPIDKDEEDDDEFGDFDDFKCSKLTTAPSRDASNQGFLAIENFDFQSTDNESQIYAGIEKTIHSLYEDDISENEDKFESSLESYLCETWGYLTETEVRQPYMVNWNNSIGQKALLKSLCIDSRNILFGAKWNNMPRYAANLGPAPLQPLKPVPAAAVSTPAPLAGSHSEGDKTGGARPIETWSESLANEGQEFTYAEALLLDLEHLMATLDQMAHNQSSLKISELLSHACNDTDKSSNSGIKRVDPAPREFDQVHPNTFPSTLTLQPLRQINLPDTHIFTPTDSEIPRSKTIHYSNIPPVASQISQDIPNHLGAVFSSGNATNQNSSPALDDEYDDFQNFQDTSSQHLPEPEATSYICNATPVVNSKIDPSLNKEAMSKLEGDNTYQTQTILEPIKLEPTMPTLNWPEPGEVKETFEDFSDFVANSPWSSLNTGTQSAANENAPNIEMHENNLHPSLQSRNLSTEIVAPPPTTGEPIEEEFDSFQFAPAVSTKPKMEILPRTDSLPVQPSMIANSPSVNGLVSPMVPLKIQSTTAPPAKPYTSQPLPPQQLQPMPVDRTNFSSQDKSNTQQILQPLSLESFSQINWPSPGVDLQDLSRFNPINAVHSLQQSASGSASKAASPAHSLKQEDDGWGDFVSIKPGKSLHQGPAPKPPADDDDWSDFVGSSGSKPPNGVNTISFNVHSHSSAQKPHVAGKAPAGGVDVPSLNYVTPKASHWSVRDSHFQNL